jgi:DNA-directed RNA polymerase subunit H (RpoH/RPB5)
MILNNVNHFYTIHKNIFKWFDFMGIKIAHSSIHKDISYTDFAKKLNSESSKHPVMFYVSEDLYKSFIVFIKNDKIKQDRPNIIIMADKGAYYKSSSEVIIFLDPKNCKADIVSLQKLYSKPFIKRSQDLLLVDYPNHILYTKIRVLKKPELDFILKFYHCDPDSFPKLFQDEISVFWSGAVVRDIVEEFSKSFNLSHNRNYKLIVSSQNFICQ